VTFETVTSEFPEFVSVTPRTLLFPAAMLPKFKLEVFAVSSAEAAIPVPVKDTVLGALERSLTMDTLPDNAPGVFGENATSIVACLPASITMGNDAPVIVTPAAVALAWVTVRLDPPPFDMVTDCEDVVPTGTDPKRIDAGATDIVAAPGVVCWLDATFGAPVSPMQPTLDNEQMSSRAKAGKDMAFLPVELVCVA
jgi:hypothetical protein